MYDVLVRTSGATQVLAIRPKADGRGSAVNGGELLMLALATCFCNDLYREAERLRIPIEVHNTIRAGLPVALIT